MSISNEEIFSPELDTMLSDYLTVNTDEERKQLRDKIVSQCLPYVEKIAKGLARRSTDPVDDLIQVGSLGLIKAIEKYNPLAGSRFKTYATYLITGEIRHYLRDKSAMIKAPRQIYELYYRVNQIVQRLTEAYGRTPTDLEIAQELQCPVTDVQAVANAERRRTPVSLDQFIVGNDGSTGETMFVERLVDQKQNESLQLQEDKLLLEKALESLKEELRVVVTMTFYDDMSQTEIAEVLGISQMQVSRRLRKAMGILQGVLNTEPVDVA